MIFRLLSVNLRMIGKNTYQPSVRIANWFEDLQLEESNVKDFLLKKENGQLLMQKRPIVNENILKRVDLTVVNDGLIHFGDIIQLTCPGEEVSKIIGRSRQCSTLAAHCSLDLMCQNAKLTEPCTVTGSHDLTPNVRTSFIVTSCDGTPTGQPLRYIQPFYLKTMDGSGGNLFLESDKFDFMKCAYQTRHQEVRLVSNPSYLTEWRIVYFNPLLRMEYEFMPVSANIQVIVNHVYTNQNLCVEDGATLIRTAFSMEYEISVHTYLNSHKAEEHNNHWILVTAPPGKEIIMPPHLTDDMPFQEASEETSEELTMEKNDCVCEKDN